MSGIQRKIFLGLILFASLDSIAAVKPPQKPQPVPVLQTGSRFFPGDPQKNEFFILSANQPDPDLGRKGPAFVNTAPLSAGIDDDDALHVNPAEILSDATPIFDEQVEIVAVNQPRPERKVQVASPETPAKTQKIKEDNSNYSQAKAYLHKLTRKIVQNTHEQKHYAVKSNHQLKRYAVSKDKSGLTIIKMKFYG